jgi:hypothetical protein
MGNGLTDHGHGMGYGAFKRRRERITYLYQ